MLPFERIAVMIAAMITEGGLMLFQNVVVTDHEKNFA